MIDQQVGVCRHCGGEIRALAASGAPATSLAFACDGCGCGWRRGMILAEKGPACPVHGRNATRIAVARIIDWLLAQDSAHPTPVLP